MNDDDPKRVTEYVGDLTHFSAPTITPTALPEGFHRVTVVPGMHQEGESNVEKSGVVIGTLGFRYEGWSSEEIPFGAFLRSAISYQWKACNANYTEGATV